MGSLYSTNYQVAICLLVVVQAEKRRNKYAFVNPEAFSLLNNLKEEEKAQRLRPQRHLLFRVLTELSKGLTIGSQSSHPLNEKISLMLQRPLNIKDSCQEPNFKGKITNDHGYA